MKNLFLVLFLVFLLSSCKKSSENLHSSKKLDSIPVTTRVITYDTVVLEPRLVILNIKESVLNRDSMIRDSIFRASLEKANQRRDSLKKDSLQRVHFRKVSKRVNGGTIGMKNRIKEWERVKRILTK